MTAILRPVGLTVSAPGRGGAPFVGPNAVTRLAEALRDGCGEAAARSVFARAGLGHMLSEPPVEMVDQQAVAGLYRALFRELPLDAATAAAAEAGRRTANYILAHRIPRAVRMTLKALPASLAGPLLLRAIARNAWTFAGSGGFRAQFGSPSVVEITDNPIAMPGCAWHVAVFEGLFRALVASHSTVRHPRCCHSGAAACRFEIAGGPLL